MGLEKHITKAVGTKKTLAQSDWLPFQRDAEQVGDYIKGKLFALRKNVDSSRCNYKLPSKVVTLKDKTKIEGKRIDTTQYLEDMVQYSVNIKQKYGFYPPMFIGYGYHNSDKGRTQKPHAITDASRHFIKHVGVARYDGKNIWVMESIGPTRKVSLKDFRRSGGYADMSVRTMSDAQLSLIQKHGGEKIMQRGDVHFKKMEGTVYDPGFATKEFEQKHGLIERSYCSEFTTDYVTALGIFPGFESSVSMPKFELDFQSEKVLELLLKILGKLGMPPIKSADKRRFLKDLIQDRRLTPKEKIAKIKAPTSPFSQKVKQAMNGEMGAKLIDYLEDPIITPGAFMSTFKEAPYTNLRY